MELDQLRYHFQVHKNVQVPHNLKHIFHIYAIKTSYRDELKTFLSKKGISTGIHYPKALPFLKPFSNLEHSIELFENSFKVGVSKLLAMLDNKVLLLYE